MRLSLALALATIGATSPIGNAFASPNISTSFVNAQAAGSSLSYRPSSTEVRGGNRDTATCLSSTKEDVAMDEIVTKFISEDNWALLSQRGQAALSNLIKSDEDVSAQTHVYGNWPEKGTDDEGKAKIAEQVSVFCFMFIF